MKTKQEIESDIRYNERKMNEVVGEIQELKKDRKAVMNKNLKYYISNEIERLKNYFDKLEFRVYKLQKELKGEN